ncbi:MAG: ABC transporter permease [Xenophilus sp.]
MNLWRPKPRPHRGAAHPRDRKYLVLAVLSPVAILALWALAASLHWVAPIILPSPQKVLASLWRMVHSGYADVPLSTHLGASLRRVGLAFLAGAVLGTITGLVRARSAPADALLLVPSEVLRPIPPLGLVPIFILWFGIGEMSKVLLILLAVFLVMMVGSQAGARSVSGDLVRAAQMMGATPLRIFRHVILPSALPQIMTSLHLAMSMALSILVAAELLGGDRGLGFIVLDAANFFRTPDVFAGVLLIGLLGLAADRLIGLLSRWLVHWQGR